MAITHKHSAFEEPFNFRGRVISMAPGESAPAGPSGDDAQAKIEAAKKAVEGERFLEAQESKVAGEKIEVKDIKSHILDRLNKANARDAEVISQNIDSAIMRLGTIQAMRKGGLMTEKEYEIALKLFDVAYKDYEITASEAKKLQMVREWTDEQLTLAETHFADIKPLAQEFRETAAEGEIPTGTALDAAKAFADNVLPEVPEKPDTVVSTRELGVAIEAAENLPEYNALAGSSAVLPDFFRGTTTYEEIDRMDDLVNGEPVYEAIIEMAAIRSEILGETDNHTFWRELVSAKLLRKDDNRAEINFNELCLATFGKNEKKVWAGIQGTETLPGVTTEQLERFHKAATMFIHYTEFLQESSVGTEQYRELRESTELSGELAKMAPIVGQIFEKNSYGPMIKLGLAKKIYYGLSKKDRPIITEDTWMSEKAYRQAYQSHGEIELISHARAYDRLMETGSMGAMLSEINRYMWLGNSMMNSFSVSEGEEAPQTEALYITMENLKDPEFAFSPTQMEAIRHGAMIIAAQEMRVFQDVAAEIEAEEAARAAQPEVAVEEAPELSRKDIRIAKRLARHLRNNPENGLSEEQIEDIQRATPGALNGSMSALIDASLGLKAGVDLKQPLPHGVEIVLIDIEGSIVLPETIQGRDFAEFQPALRLQSGVVYTSERLGKRNRWRLGARAQAGLKRDSEGWGPEAGASLYAKYDITQDGVWSAVGGLHANLQMAAVSLGVERDFQRLYSKKLAEYKEAHAEDIQKAHELLDGAAIAALISPKDQNAFVQAAEAKDTEAMNAIIAKYQGLETSPEYMAIRDAMYGYLDMMIDQGYIEDWAAFHKQIKFTGAGISAGAGWGKGAGFGIGAYATAAFGFRGDTVLRPTFQTEIVSYDIAQAAEGVTPTIPPTTELHTVQIPDYVLFTDPSQKADAEAQALNHGRLAVEAISSGMGEHVQLTPGEHFTDLEILDVQGTVRVIIDPNSNIKLIQNGPRNLALSLSRTDQPIALVEYSPGSHGGDDETIVVITDNPAANVQQVAASATGSIMWDEIRNPDGTHQRGNSVLRGSQENLYTMEEAMDAINGKGPGHRKFQEGDLSTTRAIEHVRLQAIEFDTHTRSVMQEEREPIQLTDTMKKIGEKISAKHPLDQIHKRGEENKVIADILAQFQEEGITNPTEDQIATVYQYANYIERPTGPFLDWSIEAIKTFFGDDAELFVNFINEHRDEIAAKNLMNGYLPEGAATAVFTSEGNAIQFIDGFYSRETAGEAIAVIELSALEAINKLGATNDPATNAMLERIQVKIATFDKWPKRTVDPLAYLNDVGPTLHNCANTEVGRLLKRESVNIWGTDKAAELHQMILTGNETNPELATEFKAAVQATLKKERFGTADGKTISAKIYKHATYLSFHGECVNPQITYYPMYQLDYQWKTEKKRGEPSNVEVGGGAAETMRSEAMTPETVLDYKTVTVKLPTTVGPVRTPDGEADQEGGGRVNDAAQEGETEDVNDAGTSWGEATGQN